LLLLISLKDEELVPWMDHVGSHRARGKDQISTRILLNIY